jgi:starch phosphorylase|tara:strand:+ start:959 stop:3568 length:2610 start_codon:yes stop_codon:yes gene_type:complete
VHKAAAAPPAPIAPKSAEAIADNLAAQTVKTGVMPLTFDVPAMYRATAESVQEQLMENWNATYRHFHDENPKQAYYISMEYLQGRALTNAVGNLGLTGEYSDALRSLGYTLEDTAGVERNMGLGNGGLGRLAACFLDSIATLDLPAWGYGLRYKYGLFKQAIEDGVQKEYADDWLEVGNPWEMKRETQYPIGFYGEVVDGKWVPGANIRAVAYDSPIPGYKTKNCISLRLWDAEVAPKEFDLASFNACDYDKSMRETNLASQLCAVLYPGDATREGKALRLSQQYMLCSASVQDILARFKERGNTDWSKLPEKVAIQMNDTHPTLAAPELMRILMDQEGMDWDTAWALTTKTVAYTNHTVMPEALEKWPLELMTELLPRHVEIIKRIDEEFIASVKATYPKATPEELEAKIGAMRILENYMTPAEELKAKAKAAAAKAAKLEAAAAKAAAGEEVAVEDDEEWSAPAPMVRMANLCCISGFAINGVAAIHSEIVRTFTFKDFGELWPEKFQNKTNGVTPRRWLAFCNPQLSSVITEAIGTDEWVTDTALLEKLGPLAKDPELQKKWRAAKQERKALCAKMVEETTGVKVSTDAMFDIQIKRIHEYKRQLLNIMGIIHRYNEMKAMTPEERANVTPRVCIFGGKAYATYLQAKRIVRLVTAVGEVVNNDPEIGDLLKVVFVPDYNVSLAETLIPASELSQHISTAGTEASGTSNMKFQMNGCLIIGTLDGANVEIRECVGDDNFFLFGIEEPEVEPARAERAAGKFEPDPRFTAVMDTIKSGVFGKPGEFDELLWSLEGNEGFGRGDYFLVAKDFPSYIECQDKVSAAYKDQDAWTESSIISTAFSGKFNSDRTIDQYATEIWDIKPLPVP